VIVSTQLSWGVLAGIPAGDEEGALWVDVGVSRAEGDDPVKGAEPVPLMDEVTPQPATATASRRIPLPRHPKSRRDNGCLMDHPSL
jgi:hypothetical protein